MQKVSINNYIRGTTFFQHAGIAIIFVFMPIIAKEATQSIFEIGIIVASFSFAQILSEIYFGRISDKRGKRCLSILKKLIMSISRSKNESYNGVFALVKF